MRGSRHAPSGLGLAWHLHQIRESGQRTDVAQVGRAPAKKLRALGSSLSGSVLAVDVGSNPVVGPPDEIDRGVEGWRYWCPQVRWAAGVGGQPEDLTLPQSSGGGNESA